ncbi:MAG: hypothetical protein Q8P89_03170 [bacterium]|nr:hypothetical protein [bacterium]
MPSAEREKGFFRKVAGVVREVFRNHTPEDEERIRRILSKGITDKDRSWYGDERFNQAIAMSEVPTVFVTDGINHQPVSPLQLSAGLEELRRLTRLPPEKLDSEVTIYAQKQEKAWGLTPTDESPPQR